LENGLHSRILNSGFDHTGYALASSSVSVDAENNWWGDSSGPYHGDLNPGGLGGSITGSVDFIPWLTDTTNDFSDPGTTVPSDFNLAVYPNPFNSEVTFEFALAKRERITLQMFDVTGRRVETLADEDFTAGIQRRIWNADNFSSGIYFARISSGFEQARIQKVALVK
jgi:hypothetical protein